MSVVSGYRDPHETQGRVVCRFFQRGMCRFGSRCRNVHNDATHTPKESNAVATNQPNIHTFPSRTFSAASSNATTTTSQNSASTTEPGTSTTRASSSVSSMACGICFDTVMERSDVREQTFGILPNCNHCFCFACIRKWRQTKEFDFDVSKACPECRRPSDYVYASRRWFDVQEEKEIFITKEKTRMQKIDCRYFNKGEGYCPFGNTCLYLHALRNGKVLDVGPPKPRRRRPSNLDTEMLHQILYWLNDDELDIEEDDEDLDDTDFELDLDDPTIAMQYYDDDDIRRYLAINRLMNPGGSDTESEDLDIFDFD